jgi:hypothetical protein
LGLGFFSLPTIFFALRHCQHVLDVAASSIGGSSTSFFNVAAAARPPAGATTVIWISAADRCRQPLRFLHPPNVAASHTGLQLVVTVGIQRCHHEDQGFVQQLPATLFGIESILIRSVGALFHLLAPAQLGSGSSFGSTLDLARLRIRLGSSVPR